MMRGPTSALSSGSPIPVLLSAKHAWLRGSGGIRAVSTGVIAPISHPSRFVPDPPPALRSRAKCRSGGRGIMMRGPTSALSSGSPIPVLLSAKHPWPRGSGGIRAVSAGVIAPISHPSRFVSDPPLGLRCKCTFSPLRYFGERRKGRGKKNEVRSLNFANPSEGNTQVKLGAKEGFLGAK
ncbi:hypothetical protein Ancab_002211 [Ancistrocladus abbreviatus]